MAGSRKRIVLDGFENGLVEYEVGDSTRLDRRSLGYSRNIRLTETGGITHRTGITNRAAGIPNTNYHVFEFRSNSAHALIASDGATIKVLESTGWTTIGTFSSPGIRPSAAMANQRMYMVNGINRMIVVEYRSGAWDVRDAGVNPPVTAPTLSYSGGSGSFDVPFRIAYSYVDERGFESNVGPAAVVEARTDSTITVSNIVAGPSNIDFINIYSSLSNQREMFFIKQIVSGAGTSTNIDTQNLSRDEGIPAPVDENTVPPTGIYSIFPHKARLYAAQISGFDTYYRFSSVSEPEYWNPANAQDLISNYEHSPVVNFGACSLGLQLGKLTTTMLLEGDPESTSAPQVILQGAGLAKPDATISLNGAHFFLSQRGLLAHDGIRSFELWRKLKDTSDACIAADDAYGAFKDTRAMFFFRSPDASDSVTMAAYDVDKKRWLVDEFQVDSNTATTSDNGVDDVSDVDVFENAENGSQAILLGGGTDEIQITSPSSAKLVAGVKIKFNSLATIFKVLNYDGLTVYLDGNAPANSSTIEWIRGCEIVNGRLALTA